MKITASMLRYHGACSDQQAKFEATYPDGAILTEDSMVAAQRGGFDVFFLVRLLQPEGPGGRRDFALRCAKRVVHLSPDPRVARCLRVVTRRVADPSSVTDAELDAAWNAAWDAAWAAAAAGYAARSAAAAAWNAAEDAAEDAAWDAEREWQARELARMLLGGIGL